jgi:thiamine pyrophosphokinase
MPAKKTVALVANGAIHSPTCLAPRIKQYQQIIAVDGGLYYCDLMQICPELIVGDLDSISQELLKKYSHVPIYSLPIDKDETDLECAVRLVAKPDVAKITIFGALEKRTDHALGNLHILRRYPHKVFIESETELIFAIKGKSDIPCTIGQTISFIPLGGPVTGVTSKGLKWELNNASFDKDFMSISNICLNPSIQVSIASGDLLCILQTSSSL